LRRSSSSGWDGSRLRRPGHISVIAMLLFIRIEAVEKLVIRWHSSTVTQYRPLMSVLRSSREVALQLQKLGPRVAVP
jgi:hypothetical protein